MKEGNEQRRFDFTFASDSITKKTRAPGLATTKQGSSANSGFVQSKVQTISYEAGEHLGSKTTSNAAASSKPLLNGSQ